MIVKNKRGVSPVIATVLLIALTLALIAIIFLWARGFITEQVEKGGRPVEQVCNDVSFDVDSSPTVGGLDVQIVNRGNVPIYQFDIKFVTGGDSSFKKFNFAVDVGDSTSTEKIPVDDAVTQVVLYPMVLGNVKGKKVTKATTCLEKGRVINV